MLPTNKIAPIHNPATNVPNSESQTTITKNKKSQRKKTKRINCRKLCLILESQTTITKNKKSQRTKQKGLIIENRPILWEYLHFAPQTIKTCNHHPMIRLFSWSFLLFYYYQKKINNSLGNGEWQLFG